MDELSDAQKELIKQIGYELPEPTLAEMLNNEDTSLNPPKTNLELKHPTRQEIQAEETKRLAKELQRRLRQKNQ